MSERSFATGKRFVAPAPVTAITISLPVCQPEKVLRLKANTINWRRRVIVENWWVNQKSRRVHPAAFCLFVEQFLSGFNRNLDSILERSEWA